MFLKPARRHSTGVTIVVSEAATVMIVSRTTIDAASAGNGIGKHLCSHLDVR